jgi:membrane associated rhomboid family serine protease
MRRGVADRGFTLSFPPFTYIVKWLVAINLAVYLLTLLLEAAGLHALKAQVVGALQLMPADVVHGYLWQLVTYAFVHQGFGHFFWNMIGLWMFGSRMEQTLGQRRFLTLYTWGVLGAAVFSVVLSYAGMLGLRPETATVGASGGIYAILIAFGMIFAESEVMMIFPPVSIKGKYFVWLLIVVTLIFSLQGGGNVAYIAHLGGLISGFLYVRFVHQRGRSYGTSANRYVGRGLSDRAWVPPPANKPGLIARFRDAYYRWKRRNAAKKFEVYMRKHDRRVFFDEHGNYIPSDEPPKKDNGESKGPWVN